MLVMNSLVYASSRNFDEPIMEGIYLGPNIGLSSLMDSQSNSNLGYKHLFSGTGFVGGGLIGYDRTIFEKFNLGVEAFGQVNRLSFVSTRNFDQHRYYKGRSHYNTGIRIIPGLKFDPTAIGHALIGYSSALFLAKDANNYGVFEKKTTRGGFQCGLGLETKLYKKISIRADTLYTFYSAFRSPGYSLLPSSVSQTYLNAFSTLEGSLSVIYRFT